VNLYDHMIFDCDGVLVDSEPISMRIDVELLAEHGFEIPVAEAHRRFVGKTFEAMLREIEAESGFRFPNDFAAQKNQRIRETFERELKAVEGIDDALTAIALPKSIASNSARDRVALSLRIAAIERHFGGRIITPIDVKHPKPAPDVFIKAATRAGHDPSRCIVVEDSATGVTAAVAAGCRVLGFVGTHEHPREHAERLMAIGAAAVFDHMRELPALSVKLQEESR
jgi:HAD superfamily hydrolase (TIGR01509 family)